jgi:hypothetical protein
MHMPGRAIGVHACSSSHAKRTAVRSPAVATGLAIMFPPVNIGSGNMQPLVYATKPLAWKTI